MSFSSEARSLVSLLVHAHSQLGIELHEAEGVSLGKYLMDLIPQPIEQRNQHFVKLQLAIQSFLQDAEISDTEGWQDALVLAPVIQQADHSNILLDRETFLNNILFGIAAHARGIRHILTIQCSSVTCLSSRHPLRGSPFLRWRGGIYNIFGLSKRSYHNCAFIALPKPIETPFEPLDRSTSPPNLDPFLKDFVGRKWPSAVEAFRCINSDLWKMFRSGIECDLLIADDRLTAELVALHVEDNCSPVHRLIFNEAARTVFLRCKRMLIASPYNIGVNGSEPDHFWIRESESGRLRPIIFSDGESEPYYVSTGTRMSLSFSFTASEVAGAIRRGDLIPDIILIYFTRCLLPGVNAIGGPSQQDYVELYKLLLLECDKEICLLSHEDLAVVSRIQPSRLGGAPLLEPDHRLIRALDNMMPNQDIKSVFDHHLKRVVGETVGQLECAQYLRKYLHKIRSIDCEDIGD